MRSLGFGTPSPCFKLIQARPAELSVTTGLTREYEQETCCSLRATRHRPFLIHLEYSRKERSSAMGMSVLYARCAGLDVHKLTIVACLILTSATGSESREVRTFTTTTAGLLALADWLASHEVTHVALESTGVYWRPVFNVLEGSFEVILVNAQHMKAVPGHKTDIKDSEWIADLLRHGLLKASFIPPKPVRDLRDLTRLRKSLVYHRNQAINRVQKVLETANIKLSSVASDVLGKSGRDMIEAMLAGISDAETLADLARGRLRAKLPALREALEGRVEETHRILLRHLLDRIDQLQAAIERI